MKGLYLAAPHGRLVHSGAKKAIAVAKPLPIEGERLLCSKEEGEGLCYGLVEVGPPAHLSLETFDEQFATHQVTRMSRAKWWPEVDKLLVYPILRFRSFVPPEPVEVLPGVTMDMGDVTFLDKGKGEKLLGGRGEGREGDSQDLVSELMSSSASTTPAPPLVIPDERDRIVMLSKEDEMPWTVDNPPRPAKNWTAEEKKKCVAAANAVLKERGSEQDAIFACIRAAGKTKHPGGKGIDPDTYVYAQELIEGFATAQGDKAVWTTAYINTLPDSCFLYIEPGGKKDEEGKTVPRSKRHFPYKDESGKLDLPHLRDAIGRIPQSNASGLDKAAVQKKAQNILKNAKKSIYDRVAAVMGASDNIDPDFYLNALKEVATIDKMLAESEKAGDDGDGEMHVCTCPNCGAETELPLREPCRENECPECGARLRGGGDETEEKNINEGTTDSLSKMEDEDLETLKGQLQEALASINDNHKPVAQAAIEAVDKELSARTPPQSRDGPPDGKSTLSDKALGIAHAVKDWLSSFFVLRPDLSSAITVLGRKDSSGRTWFAIWPTNAYFDREEEAFSTPSLNDFVARHDDKEVKGEAQVWHVLGSKFGTIRHQAVVADHFVCQLGTFDDTVVGGAFKEFFSKYGDGHPVVAPNGWGASHGYNYKLMDRLQDGVYNWFDTVETSVLPLEYAANPFNPKLEVFAMNDKQRALFEEVGKEVGIPDLVDRITRAGEEKKTALTDEQREHKSLDDTPPVGGDKAKKPPEQVPPEEEEEEDESQEKQPAKKKEQGSLVPDQVARIADALAERFQFGNLSKMLQEQAATIEALQAELKATQSTLAERSQEQEVAARVAAAPQYAWIRASTAAETVLKDGDPLDQELKSRQPRVSDTVSKIASKIG